MTCAHCHRPICGCSDPEYQGVIPAFSPYPGFMPDDGDDPCVTLSCDNPVAPKQATSGAATQHGRARIVAAPLERN